MKRRFRRSHIAEQIERPRLQMRRRGKLRVEVDGKERGNVIPARRRVEEVGGERGVEHKALGGQTVFQQRVHEVLDVVADLFDVGREQRAQQRVPVAGIAVEEKLRAQRLLFALLPLHDHAGEVGQREHRHMARPTEERARHSSALSALVTASAVTVHSTVSAALSGSAAGFSPIFSISLWNSRRMSSG